MGSVPGPIKLGGFVPHSTGPLNNTHISECRVCGWGGRGAPSRSGPKRLRFPRGHLTPPCVRPAERCLNALSWGGCHLARRKSALQTDRLSATVNGGYAGTPLQHALTCNGGFLCSSASVGLQLPVRDRD